ncbi:hypothetical protein TD95_005086 [Thielaviopsis punctulata]|uniref:FCP1 homology domain-containing protein n=1 Tax=Thielaviopsis punctulata TaxID=72032 RepID=A0A0F4ZF31_9PEZI|nr:hypothetical protein TD95_005086 [Thielaviopsis punctulata]
MNSLNIISSRVSPQNSPAPSRTNSYGSLSLMRSIDDALQGHSFDDTPESESEPKPNSDAKSSPIPLDDPDAIATLAHGPNPLSDPDPPFDSSESTSLLHKSQTADAGWFSLPKQCASAIIDSLRWLVSVFAAPWLYLISLFYDVDHSFRPLLPFRKFLDFLLDNPASASKKSTSSATEKSSHSRSGNSRHRRKATSTSSSGSGARKRTSSISSPSDSEASVSNRSSRASRQSDASDILPTRSIRIKLQPEDEAIRARHHRKAASSVSRVKGENLSVDISSQIKSPTSPGSALTKYPRAPAPPRPLIPRRQPSYLNMDGPPPEHQKTLILDLDETLIHSMSKGNRIGSGHMVEVRLNTTFVGMGGQTAVGPQHPILYYVHKRPYCDDFLRRISKWYKLVVFTASVQEYADPVIDWLEAERKYFAARFYRQHCTMRQGAFIKDLSTIEPDLSKVMILDNSPLSYMFHQDNAIPIQGWINDPTDNDLLHLVPLLEGLQYVSDVRALLALRGGEDGQHMA